MERAWVGWEGRTVLDLIDRGSDARGGEEVGEEDEGEVGDADGPDDALVHQRLEILAQEIVTGGPQKWGPPKGICFANISQVWVRFDKQICP